MAVAVSRALERGAPGIVCASTGNTAASAAAYGARAGLPVVVVTSRGSVARGKVIAGSRGRRRAPRDRRHVQRRAPRGAAAGRGRGPRQRQLDQSRPNRRTEASAAREVLEQLGGLPDVLALPYGGGGNTVSYARGFGETLPRFVLGEAAQRRETFASAIRIAEPVHVRRSTTCSSAPAGRSCRCRSAELERAWRSLAREEGIFCEPARSAAGIAASRGGRVARRAGRLRRHGPRPEGSRRGRDADDVRVRAPATTANLGPGFDCAGAALELWNELELTPGDSPVDRDHLGVRAFELLAPADGWSFQFTDNIPQARGLGSSASVIALGLVAAATVGEPGADRRRAARARTPARGPRRQPRRRARRGRLPDVGDANRPDRRHDPGHADRRHPGGARPDLGIESCATGDRLARRRRLLRRTGGTPRRRAREPVDRSLRGCPRGPSARALPRRDRTAPRPASRAPARRGASGATLSGAGPTVIVWARPDEEAACTNELRSRFPNEHILPLTIAQTGAGPT